MGITNRWDCFVCKVSYRKMISSGKKIIVTGSNRGIGHGLVKKLCADNKGYDVIMAVRNLESGQKILNEFKQAYPSMKDKLFLGQLDVSNPESIDSFTKWVSNTFGKVDILLNNAGMAWKGDAFNEEVVRTTFQTNFYGTIELTEKMLPLINDSGKIVTITSSAGKLGKVKSPEILQKLKADDLTADAIYAYAKEFYNDVKADNYAEKWTKHAYGLSKLFLNLWIRIFAKRPEVLSRNIQVYACCPGWVRTDMAGPNAPRSIDEGVVCPLYLVELPNEVKSDLQGQFFYDCRVTSIN
eukprot:TRINITY_DN5481_c0_g1_i1.p1 TRINITY_DN5481_c0_g1~~TRINITY_DN5481_c0_g1_i1.p1  ORF type:complete len:297 (-),score=48.91 TRINITY_DN5481_c0_g1_i1:58-948(-)